MEDAARKGWRDNRRRRREGNRENRANPSSLPVKMGATMGGMVGLCIGFLFGSTAILRFVPPSATTPPPRADDMTVKKGMERDLEDSSQACQGI